MEIEYWTHHPPGHIGSRYRPPPVYYAQVGSITFYSEGRSRSSFMTSFKCVAGSYLVYVDRSPTCVHNDPFPRENYLVKIGKTDGTRVVATVAVRAFTTQESALVWAAQELLKLEEASNDDTC